MNLRVGALVLATLTVGTHAAVRAPISGTNRGQGRSSPSSALRDTIAAADSALFGAFNQRDLTKLMTFFAARSTSFMSGDGPIVAGRSRAS